MDDDNFILSKIAQEKKARNETDQIDFNDENNKSISSLSWYQLEQLGPVGPVKRNYDEIKKQYPDKVILTIVGIEPSDFITDHINNYLVRNGMDYVVFFQSLYDEQRVLISSPNNRQMMEKRKNVIFELINNVDIMLIDRNNYFELARKGYFEPWSSYLSTEDGMKLYKSMPKNNWKSCDVDDEIYGVNGRADFVFGPPSYVVNREIMRKYKISEEDLKKPIYELEDILKIVAEGEKENSAFRVIALSNCISFNLSEISLGYLDSTAVSLYNDTTKKAGSVLDDEEYIHWLKALWQYANQGFIGEASSILDDFFITIKANSSLPYSIPLTPMIPLYNSNGKLVDSDDVVEIFLDNYYKGCLSWNNYSMYANVIPAASIHKDEAFDFLMRLYTDPFLTNILTYGIENKTFIMKDGKVEWPDMHYIGYGNDYISYPRNYEYADKNERYWKLNEELPYIYYDFVFDTSEVKTEIEITNMIMGDVSNILTENITDFDAFIADIRKKLYDNGLEKILNEVNRQRDEWLSSKKAAQEEMD